jgi:predicted Rossmann fold nucleotide-binding protein DprA/Smf involved in DNA uptake
MKVPVLFSLLVAALTAATFAAAPQPVTDFSRTLSIASKDQKLAFILLGRPACENCEATRTMIKEGKIAVTAADYVMADLNYDDPRTHDEFMRRYGKASFGNELPYVVVADAQGNLLASGSGALPAEKWNAILAKARRKLAAKPVSKPQ